MYLEGITAIVMQNFRTEVEVKKSKKQLSIHDPVLTMGSCFADTIGDQLLNSKFQVLKNPFGTVYNPISLHKLLHLSNTNTLPGPNSFIENNGIFLNYDFHSSLSALSQHALEDMLKERIAQAHNFLRSAKWLMITYGTAWIYIRKDSGETVSNCHKLPSHRFEKKLITQKRILDSFEETYEQLKSVNTNLQIILTVSPVRHVKDTLELNSVSKSTLRIACNTLTEQHADVHYFPSYEIMLDDLRDYRFYKSDMIHPSSDAEAYIWEKFTRAYFDTETLAFLEKWEKIQSGLQHKPFHVTSTAHQAFLKELMSKLNEVSSTVSVDEELAWVKNQLV